MSRKDFPTVTVIFRGYTTEQVLTAVEVLNESDKEYAVEITLNSPNVFSTIEAVSEQFGNQIWVGAGTVKNLEDAKRSIDAGASFILSPIALSKEVLSYCKENNIMTVPSGLTPTEVWGLIEDGADIVKVFPAASVSVDHMKALKGPLGEIPMMAVGGVNKGNAREFLENGAGYIGVGSSLFKKEDVKERNKEGLRKTLKEFEESLV